MEKIIQKYKFHFKNKDFLLSISIAFLFLVASLILNYFAGMYATEKASNFVTDMILSNIRVYDVDGIFTYGSVLFWFFVAVVSLIDLKKIPFTLKSIALFVIIRSIFISLTHIGPFPSHVNIDPLSIVANFTFGGDLFFSGHTGLPFLMALIFWDDFRLRILFIALAVLFGIIVLLGHLHYTIDVLSAFFITYTIYHMAERIFQKDRSMVKWS